MSIQDQIERVMTVPVARAKVWAAISEPAGLARWFSNSVDGDFRPGGLIKFTWEGYETGAARIEAIDPPIRFAYWWHPGANQPKGVPFEDLPKTLVEFMLDEVEGGTRVTLRESGFAALPDAMRESAWADNSGGWDSELRDLQRYLGESGAV